MSIRKLYGQNYDYIGNIHGDTPGPLPGCGMALIFLHRKGLILLDQTQLAEQLAACAVRGVPPTARLRRLLRRMWRQALFCAPAPGVCCDISHCAAQLCLLLGQLCPQPGQCTAFTGPGAGLCAVLLLPKGPAAALRPPRYALWAYDQCSPPFSLLPLRLILPD